MALMRTEYLAPGDHSLVADARRVIPRLPAWMRLD
jgi:hypothetical protein